jgi:predicted GH43/DUF377 family glycosyl hydrolase
MIKLKRYSNQPLLIPKPENTWEASAVFNCGAVYFNELVHLIYRATDISSGGQEGAYTNCLGYAVSKDGIDFRRLEEPILSNDVPQEARGPEDPRIVKIDDTFYMMYTGYGGRFEQDYRICLATSQNLIKWKRHGVILDEPNKDASLFPEKIGGKYAMFHRRHPDIWLSYSQDLISWEDHTVVMSVVPDSKWENTKIGISGPPIKIKDGWLLIYHGVDHSRTYRLGIALLDLANPANVLSRQAEPILEPVLEWELFGHVNNVVFSCGQVILDNTLYVYYGGGDKVIGLATFPLSNIQFE